MKKIDDLLVALTIAAPLVAFAVIAYIGEMDIFFVPGMMRYIWIFYLFVPIAIASFVIGVMLKKQGEPYKKNIVVAVIVLPILLLFGSYRLLFHDTLDFSTSIVEETEQKISFELPDEVKVATQISEDYKLGYAKFLDDEEKTRFEEATKTDERWCGKLPTALRNALPYSLVGAPLDGYDTVLFWNETLKEYNTYPEKDGDYKCLVIAYEQEHGSLMIFSDYILRVESGEPIRENGKA